MNLKSLVIIHKSLAFRFRFLLLGLSWAQSVGFYFIVFRAFLILFGISLAPLFIPKTEKVAYFSSYLSSVIIPFLSVWSVLKYNEQ